MNILGSICAVLAAIAIPMYFLGPWLRRLGQNVYGFGASKDHLHKL